MNDTQIDLGDGLWLQLSTPHETRVIREYLEDLWQWKVDCEEFRLDLLKSEARVKVLEEALRESAKQHRVIAGMDMMCASAVAYNAARAAEAIITAMEKEKVDE
jgi:3-dehydroquinate dehydratase